MQLKQQLASGQKLIGCFASIPHPMSIEICASQGVDVLCIDAEHSQVGRERIEELIRACDGAAVPAMVRVPGAHQEWIASVLEAGASAVLVPRVSTDQVARFVVQSALYPPRGERGLGPGRASGYGYKLAGHIAVAEARVIVAVQIETAEGLNNADSIAAVDGIDMVFVGPFDLDMSLRARGQITENELVDSIVHIGATALRHGKTAGIFCREPADVKKWAAAGFSFFLVRSDAMFLGASASICMRVARAAANSYAATNEGEP